MHEPRVQATGRYDECRILQLWCGFMDKRSLLALERECSSTLQAYIDHARKTCSMLRMSKGEPLSADDLRKIMHQRSLENEAHGRYMEVRERLFEIAHRGYGKHGSTQG